MRNLEFEIRILFGSVNFLLFTIGKCSIRLTRALTVIYVKIYYNFIKTFRSVQSSLQETSTCQFSSSEELVSILRVTLWMNMNDLNVESLFPEEAISLGFFDSKSSHWYCVSCALIRKFKQVKFKKKKKNKLQHVISRLWCHDPIWSRRLFRRFLRVFLKNKNLFACASICSLR